VNSHKLNKTVKEVIEFVNKPDTKSFGKIALELYNLHRESNPVYKKYDRGELKDWREIPLMPISEFKNGDVGIVPSDRMPFPGVEFHSSGTTGRDKSKHRMYDTEAYRAAIAGSFSYYVDDNTVPVYRVVLLTPTLANSSLYYMMSYISELHDHRGIREQFSDMTDSEKVKGFVEDLVSYNDGPVLLFGTSLAFYDFIESVKSAGLEKIQLPSGSTFIETGGWKGRNITITPQELTNSVIEFFGLIPDDAQREYSMSEISSQLYSSGNLDPVEYMFPEWLSVRLVDPLTQTEVKFGETGIISFVDLANVWSCPFILTEDLGHFVKSDYGTHLVLEGRAPNAPEKGCSLTYAQAMDN